MVPGAQDFGVFSHVCTSMDTGTTGLGPARGRAPPGGHGWYRGPLQILELRTLQLFTTFHNFLQLSPPPATGAGARRPCPPQSATRRPRSVLQPPASPGAQYFATFYNFSQLFTTFTTTSHRGRCQAAMPASERRQAATLGTGPPGAPEPPATGPSRGPSSPADRATCCRRIPPHAARRDASNEPSHVPLRRS